MIFYADDGDLSPLEELHAQWHREEMAKLAHAYMRAKARGNEPLLPSHLGPTNDNLKV